MKEEKGMVSVLMPVYNGMPLIQASLQSLLNQSYSDWECIIVDDGSTDGTKEHLDALEDPRFVIHHFENNQGRPLARQKALELARGEFIAMLDADDLYHPAKLYEQVALMNRYPEVKLVSSGMCSFGTNAGYIRIRSKGDGKIHCYNRNDRFPVSHAPSMLRREHAVKFKYDETLKESGEDIDYLSRYLDGGKYINLPEVHYYYSEFDSVTKRKIRNSYRCSIKKHYKSREYADCLSFVAKLIYSDMVYPFMTSDSILKRRGTAPLEQECGDFQKYCYPLINNIKKSRICFVVSYVFTAEAFLRGHIQALSQHYDVYMVANLTGNDSEATGRLKLAGHKSITINREISIVNDIKAVFALHRYFKEMDFKAVHSVTPKAGFVAALAGIISRVPNRIHIFTGQVWATKKGPMRWMLMVIDRLTVWLNTEILIDGKSQRQFLINHNIVRENNSCVIGEGSISGVDTERFKPCDEDRKDIRAKLGITDDKVVFIYLGRLNRDKGIDELLQAFCKLSPENKSAYLLLVGSDEENYTARFADYACLKSGINFQYQGKTQHPEKFLQAGDVFCLPTYREGFGTSVIEASCLGLPVICSDTYGVLDAMVDNQTGLRCKVKDVESLYGQMKLLATDEKLRALLGKNGRERVLEKFSGKVITQAWVEFYKNLVNV